MHLLALPYDIRHQIYEHLFPPGHQIYIQVRGGTLISMTQDKCKIPAGLFLTCRALNEEASEYLYNRYLFNIIGTKHQCLTAYEEFLMTVGKYARNDVHVNAFSNGTHSSTMCISIHSGDGRTAVLKRRERGELTTIDELWEEVAASKPSLTEQNATRSRAFAFLMPKVACAAVTLLVLLFARSMQLGDLCPIAVGFLVIWVLGGSLLGFI